jgi:transcriptional regulator with XRE-family HTH domain
VQQPPFRIVFGKRVRQLRKQKKMTQEELAEAANLSRETISRIENGKRGTHFEYVDQILKALNVTLQDFFDFSDL